MRVSLLHTWLPKISPEGVGVGSKGMSCGRPWVSDWCCAGHPWCWDCVSVRLMYGP